MKNNLPQKTDRQKSRSKIKNIPDIKADLFLIDSSSYFYRAYYALPTLTNSKGIPTGATLGYSRMLTKLIKGANVRYGSCLFDSRESLRKESYKDYKANRKKMPDDLVSQVDYLTDISYLLGFNTFKLKGYEADDLIAYIVNNYSEKLGISTCIVSSDKDLKQLLSENVCMYDALKNTLITAKGFEEECGIKPNEYLYILALMGDASDNIPGIKGIGEKTAFNLIRAYKSLDGVYENIDMIKQQKLRNLLVNYKEDAYTSLKLASFYKDIDINEAYFTPKAEEDTSESGKGCFCVLDDFTMMPKDDKGLYSIFKALELNSLSKELGTGLTGNNNIAGDNRAVEPCIDYCDDIKNMKIVSIYIDPDSDKHSSGLNFTGDNAEGLIHIFSKATGNEATDIEGLTRNSQVSSLLQDDSICKIGHDLPGIKRFLDRGGVKLNNLFFDIKIASYLLNPIRHTHSFTDIKNEFEDEINGLGGLNTENPAFSVYALYKIMRTEIEKDTGLKHLFYNVDMPLSNILSGMEYVGFMVDKDKLMSLSAELDVESKRLASILHKIAGREFNVNSPKQLSEVMFIEMKFDRIRKNSTDIGVLLALRSKIKLLLQDNGDKTVEQYLEFINSLISYRSKIKLKTSFTDVLLREIDRNNRVHTSFSQVATSTGRLASQSPNLQNIPVTGAEGTKIRQSFIAKEGCVLLSADYSQIDLRVIASVSNDKALIESFNNNEDIHTKTASEIFKVKPDEVSTVMRRKAKIINFGIIYGMSFYGLSKELGISAEEAKLYIDLFFQNHNAIKNYMERTVNEAKLNGFVKTAFGRKCYIVNIHSKIKKLVSYSERAAINAPIQGTAADIIKIAMVNIDKKLSDNVPLERDAKMILQVHDELIFEVKESLVDNLKEIVTVAMTDKNLLPDVPLSINIGVGRNWAEAH